MLSEKNLSELELTDKQYKKYKEFEHKTIVLKNALIKCKVHRGVIDRIISRSDLNKVDTDNVDALEEHIKTKWSDFII